jgi:uncharacterized protein (DUF2141 family)
MTPTKTTLTALLCATLLAAGHACADPGTLTITMKQVGDAPGNLRALLYGDPATFRKEDKALQVVSVPAANGEVQLLFKDVVPGRYAIMVYHDANADGKLNLRLGMFPTEGYGLSNNPQVFGPPKFADSAFDVDAAGAAIDIKLAY